eukprot:1678605-Prymnesium_polylepis.1
MCRKPGLELGECAVTARLYGITVQHTHTHTQRSDVSPFEALQSMASFVRSAPPRRAEWSLEDAAQFAALKEFKLLQLLSTDKKALATACRLGFLFGHTRKRSRTLLQLL